MKIKIFSGDYPEAEREFYRAEQQKATETWQAFLTKIGHSEEAREKAAKLQERHGYGPLRRKMIAITTLTGDRITIPSWYAVKAEKKRGRKKKGPNGRGDHLLLRFWGFMGKYSLNYASLLARTAIACPSYELAAATLAEQGIERLSSTTVDETTQKVGAIAQAHRARIALAPQESFAGKRVMIAIDGGRVRTREKRSGRYADGQQRARFDTAWREPKLVVIAELDEEGTYRKGTKPLYEATMDDHDAIFSLLRDLALQTGLSQAREIILSGDGAAWIWQKFAEFSEQLGIRGKVTEVLDFYHATEHLSAIAEAAAALKPQERKRWFRELRELLRAGRFDALRASVEKESQAKRQGRKLMKLFQYFVRNRERIRYDVYEQRKQPIGSGIVESAVRRVINLKLKAPSIFWNTDRLERVLQLRCILMAGRWNVMIGNLFKIMQLRPEI